MHNNWILTRLETAVFIAGDAPGRWGYVGNSHRVIGARI